MSEPIHILSLGAGVQSSTLALMAACGEITPMPTAAIFADTQSEPDGVYDWLHFLTKRLPFPVITVSKGNLAEDSVKVITSTRSGKKYMKGGIPAFTFNPDGSRGLLGRKCTRDYKVDMITRHTRTLCDWKRGEKRPLVKMWIGISHDEIIRMKPNREAWIENVWPLVQRKMTRQDCLQWMKANEYPEPPRSACVFCPFHSDHEWDRLKTKEPIAFEQAAAYEDKLHAAFLKQEVLTGKPYLHDSGVPIREVNFQVGDKTPGWNLFGEECEGMCGV